MQITHLHAREILDSKGHPTVEVEVTLADGTRALGAAPSGASTGATEATELRDGDQSHYFGKGVLNAVNNANTTLADALIGMDAIDQRAIDQAMITADGTTNKSHIGSNATTAASMAICRAAANSQKLELHEHIAQLSGDREFTMPQPMILLIEGGAHGNWATDIQEFMIIPKQSAFPTFREALRVGAETFHVLGKILEEKNYATGVGFEGAYAPQEINSNEEGFQLMCEAVERAGYILGDEVVLAADFASAEFYTDGQYVLRSENNTTLSTEEWTQKLLNWTHNYPLWSLEDLYDQEAWGDWASFVHQAEGRLQIVGDDFITTNVQRIQKAIDHKAITSALIKVNQIGTVSETLDAIALAHSAGFTNIVSHRGGETNDDFIADLVVGTVATQCKFGGPDRGERLAKYNRVLRIEEQLHRRS